VSSGVAPDFQPPGAQEKVHILVDYIPAPVVPALASPDGATERVKSWPAATVPEPSIAMENARLYSAVQESDRRKNEFLAMVAHELRNPLAVSVWLPAQPLAAESEPDPVPRGRAVRAGAPSRILVVDDLAASADTMKMLLEMEGFPVRVASEGATALQIAGEFRPDVVLLDIGLPGMNGFEVAHRLRGLPCCRDALLIALTGYGEAESRARSAAAGFDFHMVKPADVNLLLSMLADPQQTRRDHAHSL
jgi:CheY-like chemotaxis protein